MLTHSKGDVLLLLQIPKTEDPPLFTVALVQLWTKFTWIPPAGKEEKIFTLEEINNFQESKRVIYKSKGGTASQQVLKLNGFFEESFHFIFLLKVELHLLGVL